MSFTTVETVKKHIVENRVAVGQVDCEPVKLVSGSQSRLMYPPVTESSEVVKAREQIKPDYEAVIFAGSDQVSLAKSELIRESLVVASDSSLGTIYKENIDYAVDYRQGRLTRIASGDIQQDVTISIWYVPYRVYTNGTDYNIDYDDGKLSLIGSGDIESGQIVYVDYISEYAYIDDDIIANAIEEANEQIINHIDSIYSSSSDRSLVVAETYLATSILCRIKALRAVTVEGNARLSTWSGLADQYKKDAYLMLQKFAGSLGGLTGPQKA